MKMEIVINSVVVNEARYRELKRELPPFVWCGIFVHMMLMKLIVQCIESKRFNFYFTYGN